MNMLMKQNQTENVIYTYGKLHTTTTKKEERKNERKIIIEIKNSNSVFVLFIYLLLLLINCLFSEKIHKKKKIFIAMNSSMKFYLYRVAIWLILVISCVYKMCI